FFSSRRRHTRFSRDWSSDVCSSDLERRLWDEHPDDCGAATPASARYQQYPPQPPAKCTASAPRPRPACPTPLTSRAMPSCDPAKAGNYDDTRHGLRPPPSPHRNQPLVPPPPGSYDIDQNSGGGDSHQSSKTDRTASSDRKS